MARALSYGYHITVPYITVYRNRLLQAIQLAVLDLEEGHAPDPFRYSDYNVGHPSFGQNRAKPSKRFVEAGPSFGAYIS